MNFEFLMKVKVVSMLLNMRCFPIRKIQQLLLFKTHYIIISSSLF
jgi:hypothetical protein